MLRESKIGWVQYCLRHLSVPKFPGVRWPSRTNFIKTFETTNYKGSFDSTITNGRSESKTNFGFSNTKYHSFWTCRIDERPQDVKHGSKGQGLTIRGYSRQCWMIMWRKYKCKRSATYWHICSRCWGCE